MAPGAGSGRKQKSLMDGLNRYPVKVWDRSGLKKKWSMDPPLRDVQKLATFCWGNDKDRPLMVVPGEPRIFNEWAGGQLMADSEVMPLVGENRPKFPLEPVFRGVELCSGQPLDRTQYDIITTRDCLNLLLMYCDVDREGAVYYPKQTFRLEVERMGKTVFLMEDPGFVLPRPTNKRTYGLDFERRCAPPPPEDSLLRGISKEVLSYRLGNLKLLVYSDVDCIIPAKDGAAATGKTQPADDMDDPLMGEMGSLSVGGPLTPQLFSPDSPLQYLQLGSFPESYKTVELATASINPNFQPKFNHGIFANMYFSQMDFLYFGQHKNRLCNQLEFLNFKQVTKRIGGFPSSSVYRLVSLLCSLVTDVRKTDEQQGYALIWFPLDRRTGESNSKRLNLFQKELSEPILHALPETLRQELGCLLEAARRSGRISGAWTSASGPWIWIAIGPRKSAIPKSFRRHDF